jgi:hypothetical protein
MQILKNDNPLPEIEPQPSPMPDQQPGPKKSKQAKKSSPTENIQEMGTPEIPVAKSNIHVMTIIGQIEGQLSIQKTPKYWSCVFTPKTL